MLIPWMIDPDCCAVSQSARWFGTSPVSATMMPRLMQFWSGGLLVAAPMKLALRLNRQTGA